MESLTQKKKVALEKQEGIPANQIDGKEVILHGKDKQINELGGE